MMEWLAPVLTRVAMMGVWGPVVFCALYVCAAILIVVPPPVVLTVAAGALYGVWRGSLLVFIAASLGATAAYALSRAFTGTWLVVRVNRDPRISLVRQAVAQEGSRVQFLLRLSPVVPYTLLNYALGLAGVPYRDFVRAFGGMLPAIVMYTYYGRVVGDVARLAAGVAPPRGPEYYVLLGAGVVATIVASMMIARAARRAIAEQRTDAK
jgi:uncharacterized membrane protein YdjX (TVP38/TMEM64 family)